MRFDKKRKKDLNKNSTHQERPRTMKRKTAVIAGIMMLTTALTFSADSETWKEKLSEMLMTEDAERAEALAIEIAGMTDDWRSVYDAVAAHEFPEPEAKGRLIEDRNLCIDDVERPFIYYVPDNYDPQKATPLLVVLHGGVGRKDIIDDRIVFGFMAAEKYEGKGVKVDKIVDENTFACKIGMKDNDVIIKCDDTTIDDMNDLAEYKKSVERGDPVTVTVLRDEQEVKMNGRLPEKLTYFLFKREYPSARAEAVCAAGKVDIKASRLDAFTLFIHPDLFRIEDEITVSVNDKTVFSGIVEPDIQFMLKEFLETRDRRNLSAAKLSVKMEEAP